jgi:shikimate kinase
MNKKPKAIVIYGITAVGKLTVAKVLQEKLGYKLAHNHQVNDLVWSIFERGTLEANTLIEKFRFELYEASVKSGKDIIITHCYSNEYISPTGLSDPDYLKNLETKLGKWADVLFVHLQTDRQVLFERVKGESRKEHRKLKDESKLNDLLNTKGLDLSVSAPVKNNLVINNSTLSPGQVAEMIIKRVQA